MLITQRPFLYGRGHAMNLLLLLPLAFPFACLALLSLIAFLGVVMLGGAFYVVGAIKSGLGLAGRGSDGGEDPWRDGWRCSSARLH